MATKPQKITHVLVYVYIEEGILNIRGFNKDSVKSMIALEMVDIEILTSSDPEEFFNALIDATREADREEQLHIILTLAQYNSALKKGLSIPFDNSQKYR